MFSGFATVFFLPLSLSLTSRNGLFPVKTIYTDFIDVLKTSDDCLSLFQFTVLKMHQLNRTEHIAIIQKDLFQKYIEMRNDDLSDVDIEPILNIYCRAKIHVPILLNSWKPLLGLTGNFTLNLTSDSRENDDYHLAKHKEKVFLAAYEKEKQKAKFETVAIKTDSFSQSSDIKQICRAAAFIISFSLAISIQNLMRMYYEVVEDDDDDEHPERLGFYGEIIQFSVLVCSLSFVLMYLYADPE